MDASDAAPPRLSFVVPVFNEEESLNELFTRIRKVVNDETLGSFEILFIDDGSTDTSWKHITALKQENTMVRGIRFRRNFGKAEALAVGFDEAKGDIVITMDADLQDVPEEVPKLIAKLEEGFDLVSGWKQNRQDPLEKRLPSKLFNAVTGILTGLRLHDFNCGFKAYRKEVTHSIKLYGELHRFIPALAHAEGYRVAEIAVEHKARVHGHSKYGFGRYFKGFLDLLTVVSTTRFLQRPLHFFGSVGVLLAFIGFLILGGLSFFKLFFGMNIESRPLFFLGILSVLASLQLFSIGLLAELINRQLAPKDLRKIIAETLDP